MKRGLYISIILVVAALQALAQDKSAPEGYSNIEFVENKGQWDSRVKFKGDINIGAVYLEKTGFSVYLYNPSDLQHLYNVHHGMGAGGNSTPSKSPKVAPAAAPPLQSPGKGDGHGGQGDGGSGDTGGGSGSGNTGSGS